MRPRNAGGEISAMYMGAATNTAPTPSPDSSRATMSIAYPLAAAATRAETANITVAIAQHGAPADAVGERTGQEYRDGRGQGVRRHRPAELEFR